MSVKNQSKERMEEGHILTKMPMTEDKLDSEAFKFPKKMECK